MPSPVSTSVNCPQCDGNWYVTNGKVPVHLPILRPGGPLRPVVGDGTGTCPGSFEPRDKLEVGKVYRASASGDRLEILHIHEQPDRSKSLKDIIIIRNLSVPCGDEAEKRSSILFDNAVEVTHQWEVGRYLDLRDGNGDVFTVEHISPVTGAALGYYTDGDDSSTWAQALSAGVYSAKNFRKLEDS